MSGVSSMSRCDSAKGKWRLKALCSSNPTYDAANCGTCGNVCPPATPYCALGVCASLFLYHGWTCPIAGCITTGYNAVLPTDDGGNYPYNTGDSNACRAWKLAATICNTEPTAYYDTGNWSCPSSGGFTDPVFGSYCAVSNQYSCSGCPAACNAACMYNPLSLRN